MTIRNTAIACALAALFAQPISGQKPAGEPRAAASQDPAPHRKPGGIAWAPSLQAAIAESAEDGRPVITYWTFDT